LKKDIKIKYTNEIEYTKQHAGEKL